MAAQIETTKTQRRQPVRRETHHVLRRGGLFGVEDLLQLAQAEGLSDQEIRGLARGWQERRWPKK